VIIFTLIAWYSPITSVYTLLPLKNLNNALREVAFEGRGLWDVRSEIGILLLWGVVVYFVAIKVFKWE
jgi:ABC-2 type transport system permease protein